MAKTKTTDGDEPTVTPLDARRLRDLAAGWTASEAELTVGPADARALEALGCPAEPLGDATGAARVTAADLVAAVEKLPDDPAELPNDDGEPEAERLAKQSPKPAAGVRAAGGAAQTAAKRDTAVPDHQAKAEAKGPQPLSPKPSPASK